VKELTLAGGSGTGAAIMEQLAPDNPWAELAGQILGSVSTAGAVGTGKRLITAFPVRDEGRLAAAETMRREGVDLTAGQQTGNKSLQSFENEWGGARLADLTEQQAKQFTRATLSGAGIDAERMSPTILEAGRQRLLAGFGDYASRNTLRQDQQFSNDLREKWEQYAGATAPSDRTPAIRNFVDVLEANTGPIDGDAYVGLRKWLDDQAGLATSPAAKSTLNGFQHALDDAMERSMSELDIDDFRQLCDEYRSFLTIDQMMKDAPASFPFGLISPAALSKAAMPKPGRRTYAAGDGDFADLARSGVEVMTPATQAGVPPTTRRLANAMPLAIGGLIGHSFGDTQATAAGALAGAFAPTVAGAAALSNAGRRYLANQILNGPPSGSNGLGPLSAMFAAQTSQLSPGRDPLAELAGLAGTVELMATKPGPIEITVRGGNTARPQ
jgi:hypothetical protein